MSYSSLNPELIVEDARKAIEWYGKVFDAKLEFEHPGADGKKLMHTLLRLPSGSTFFVVDDFPENHDGKSRVRKQTDAASNNSCVTVSVSNGEEIFKRAVDNDAHVTLKFEKQSWGAVYGRFSDPFGHEWAIDQREAPAEVAEVAKDVPNGTTAADAVVEDKTAAVGEKHSIEGAEEPDAKKLKPETEA